MELRVKDICKEKGLSITGLAGVMNVSKVTLSQALNGNPTIGTLQKIATALGVPFIELFEAKSDNSRFICSKCGVSIVEAPNTSTVQLHGADAASLPAPAGVPDISLSEYVRQFIEQKKHAGKEYMKYGSLLKHLGYYKGDVALYQVDKAYIDGFAEYLCSQTNQKGVPITPKHYICFLKTILYSVTESRDWSNRMRSVFLY